MMCHRALLQQDLVLTIIEYIDEVRDLLAIRDVCQLWRSASVSGIQTWFDRNKDRTHLDFMGGVTFSAFQANLLGDEITVSFYSKRPPSASIVLCTFPQPAHILKKLEAGMAAAYEEYHMWLAAYMYMLSIGRCYDLCRELFGTQVVAAELMRCSVDHASLFARRMSFSQTFDTLLTCRRDAERLGAWLSGLRGRPVRHIQTCAATNAEPYVWPGARHAAGLQRRIQPPCSSYSPLPCRSRVTGAWSLGYAEVKGKVIAFRLRHGHGGRYCRTFHRQLPLEPPSSKGAGDVIRTKVKTHETRRSPPLRYSADWLCAEGAVHCAAVHVTCSPRVWFRIMGI
jgi:hypothetical protein